MCRQKAAGLARTVSIGFCLVGGQGAFSFLFEFFSAWRHRLLHVFAVIYAVNLVPHTTQVHTAFLRMATKSWPGFGLVIRHFLSMDYF